jgi:hypothetical protein
VQRLTRHPRQDSPEIRGLGSSPASGGGVSERSELTEGRVATSPSDRFAVTSPALRERRRLSWLTEAA